MLKAIIVDDEMPAREELKFLLKEFNEIDIIGEASNGVEAIKLNEKLRPDLIFLDIQMPQITGIEVAEKVLDSTHVPLIIFVTAFDQFAIKAFEVNAIDYLLKPLCKERLEKSIKKAINLYKAKNYDYENKLEKLIKEIKGRNEKVDKISVYKNGRLIPLDLDEIIYATVKEKNTVIVSTKGEFETNNTLSQLQEKLKNHNFFRSHRSFLVNLDFIEEIEPWFNSTYQVKLKNNKEKIPVSRNHCKEFRKLMNID
ncbi:LytR/AlgR family response regulator transcription factor [Thermohalobacter berrensis]|uniref:DNA-binding response regulator n=1 Tax=Thermohalobacter berrensis TaxID=99594 RepID=A0A419T288_9FIRM|nr:LytTR family transcriptional regulator DNA-binding domain-containing protein [Thermohalobacter berrensis]RKD31562.1 DNA-binding response regulator [Thermohalobacter berrensis]